MTNNGTLASIQSMTVVNRFQKMYLCYDEQLTLNNIDCVFSCESLSKNVSLL